MSSRSQGAAAPLPSGPEGTVIASHAAEIILRSRLADDAYDRLQVTASGSILVGSGVAAPAVALTLSDISSLPSATSLDGTELFPLVQAGVTKKLASTLLATQAELDAHLHTGTYVDAVKTQAGTAAAPTPTTIWRFNEPADDTEHGPFALTIGGAMFQSTFDRVMYLGYNAADGGGLYEQTEPKFAWVIESDYDDSTSRKMEAYVEYSRANSTLTRTDGVTTSGSPTVTSATGGFNQNKHRYQRITGTGIPADTYIGVVNSATSIGLSSSNTANVPVNATATATGVTLTVSPSGPVSFRPFFFNINRATGTLHFELNSTNGISFGSTDGAQTIWGNLTSQGLTITPYTGQNVSLVLGWVAGGQNAIQINNSTNGFLLQSIAPGNGIWEIRVGANQSFSFGNNGITLGGAGGTFTAGKDGGFFIYRADAGATLPIARNIGNEMYIGGNSTWTGISFQAGGSTSVRFTPTLLAFHGAGGSAQKSAVADADGTLADITTKFNAMLAYWRSRGDVAV